MSNAQLASFKIPEIKNETFVRALPLELVEGDDANSPDVVLETLCTWFARPKGSATSS